MAKVSSTEVSEMATSEPQAPDPTAEFQSAVAIPEGTMATNPKRSDNDFVNHVTDSPLDGSEPPVGDTDPRKFQFAANAARILQDIDENPETSYGDFGGFAFVAFDLETRQPVDGDNDHRALAERLAARSESDWEIGITIIDNPSHEPASLD